MTGGSRLWADRALLREVQYRTDANLAARQSIYAYRQPQLDLYRHALDLAALTGRETVADIGCGNGSYLAELGRRGHQGAVLGLDLSAGMLRAARGRAPEAWLAVGDAAALPVRDDAADVALAMHMLYHVPDPRAAVRELRRITAPGGRVLVALNGADHLQQLWELVTSAAHEAGPGGPVAASERLRLDDGAELLSTVFGSVIRHDLVGDLVVPGRRPVEAYVRSVIGCQEMPDPEHFLAAFTRRLDAALAAGALRVRVHSGVLICS